MTSFAHQEGTASQKCKWKQKLLLQKLLTWNTFHKKGTYFNKIVSLTFIRTKLEMKKVIEVNTYTFATNGWQYLEQATTRKSSQAWKLSGVRPHIKLAITTNKVKTNYL